MADWFSSLNVQTQDALLVVGVASLTNVACAIGLLSGAAPYEPVR